MLLGWFFSCVDNLRLIDDSSLEINLYLPVYLLTAHRLARFRHSSTAESIFALLG